MSYLKGQHIRTKLPDSLFFPTPQQVSLIYLKFKQLYIRTTLSIGENSMEIGAVVFEFIVNRHRHGGGFCFIIIIVIIIVIILRYYKFHREITYNFEKKRLINAFIICIVPKVL